MVLTPCDELPNNGDAAAASTTIVDVNRNKEINDNIPRDDQHYGHSLVLSSSILILLSTERVVGGNRTSLASSYTTDMSSNIVDAEVFVYTGAGGVEVPDDVSAFGSMIPPSQKSLLLHLTNV